jgi:hypothetical protein
LGNRAGPEVTPSRAAMGRGINLRTETMTTTMKIDLEIDWDADKAHVTAHAYEGSTDPRLQVLMREISCTVEETMYRIGSDEIFDPVAVLYQRDHASRHDRDIRQIVDAKFAAGYRGDC